jgi:hypothetical protein
MQLSLSGNILCLLFVMGYFKLNYFTCAYLVYEILGSRTNLAFLNCYRRPAESGYLMQTPGTVIIDEQKNETQ